MLELFGIDYVTEHCIAAIRAERQEEQYRCYVANCQFVLSKLVSRDAIKKQLYEILHPAPVDERSAEEIVADNIKRMGLKVVN